MAPVYFIVLGFAANVKGSEGAFYDFIFLYGYPGVDSAVHGVYWHAIIDVNAIGACPVFYPGLIGNREGIA